MLPRLRAAVTAGWTVAALMFTTPAASAPVDLPGVSAFNYVRDGVAIIEQLDKVLKILNPNPVEGLVPKLAISFNETASQAVLLMAGGNFGTPDRTQTFSLTGTYWTVTWAVTQDAAAVVGFDSVDILGNFVHVKGPHGDDAIGPPLPFAQIIVFGGANCCDSSAGRHPNMHGDDLSATSDAIYTNVVFPPFGTVSSDITVWNAAVTTRHTPIPEPAAPLLIGVGLALACGRSVWRATHSAGKRA